MQLQVRLVHAEPGSRVVEVSAHAGAELLGSALGEAASAEAAEDRAIARLLQRLDEAEPQHQRAVEPPLGAATPAPLPAPSPVPAAAVAAAAAASPQPPQPVGAAADASEEALAEPPADPEDWSAELAQIDLELRRLGWQREQEATYLGRAFHHPSRSRLTSYGDLVAYLQALQTLDAGSDPATAAVPLRRRDLLAQSDQLLGRLQWDAAQGRQFLEQHFQRSSRQQLSDSQLLQFNMLLEGALIGV
jgi:hypothetical protein